MKRKPPKSLEPLLREVKDRLREIYGDDLKKVILYGSYARGDNEADSDVDILLVLLRMEYMSSEQKKYMPSICEIDLRYDKIVSIIPLDEDYYLNKITPLLLNVQKDGIVL